MRKHSRRDPIHKKIIYTLESLSLKDIIPSKKKQSDEKKYRRNKKQLRLNLNTFQKYNTGSNKIYALIVL